MVKHTQLLFSLLFSLLLVDFTEAGRSKEPFRVSNGICKLFVFGDSYVDTGNFLNSGSYKPPSGITFPGKPAGRFCDGRVLTDFVASFLRIESPVPYRLRNSVDKSNLIFGMNFAYGGTGVFNTLVDGPNMTAQIDYFQQLVEQNIYTKQDLESSIGLVNSGGNDYATFAIKNGSIQDIPAFATSLVNQLSLNLQRIHSLGVKKVAVGLLEPIGCLPLLSVASSYQNCSEWENSISSSHSQMLLQSVQNLNHDLGQPAFVALDLYNAFLSTITTMQKRHSENSTLMNPLMPCCVGVSGEYSCGSVDNKGAKKYNVCEKPELSLFWDNEHPSQNGWYQVHTALQSSLQQLTSGIC